MANGTQYCNIKPKQALVDEEYYCLQIALGGWHTVFLVEEKFPEIFRKLIQVKFIDVNIKYLHE